MSMKAAQRRGVACPDTEELLLLHNIAALEEVENCSTLVLQELLQHKPLPSPHSPAPSGGIEQQGLFALRQVLHLQQASHTLNLHTQSHDSLHSRPSKHHHLHSMQHAAPHPHPNDQPPAHESSSYLLNQALECSVLSSSGLMGSGELLDHLVISSKGMTLPALCSEPLPSRKTSISALKVAKRASLRRAKKSSTFSAQFSPPELGIIDSPCNGGKMATSMCAQPKKCIPANHFLTERQRREFLNEKYQVLRSLIPNPTKADRASIVQDAIDHVNELKEHVEKLRLEKGSRDLKRRKVDDDMSYCRERGEARSCETGQHLLTAGKGCQEGKMCIRAQMTSKYGTGIDVRVMDDEATIKVTHHRSQDSFLLVAVLMLHEAQLELLHANGASIGNHHVYMLNVKIAEGKAVGAAQIAKQLLERFDAFYAPTPSC